MYLFVDDLENLLQVEIYKLDKNTQREIGTNASETHIYNVLRISQDIY